MSLKLEEIKNLIKEAMPDAEITIIDLAGDNNITKHYYVNKKALDLRA